MIEPLDIDGLLLIKPRILADDRGAFLETFRQQWFESVRPVPAFVQDNLSTSRAGVVRGLHYQIGDHIQGKLVTVSSGAILDVAVDIRHGSPTFGRWIGVELTSDNRHELWIPPGFAHGFSVIGDHAVVQYKCTNYYHKESERGIRWDDPGLGIDWRVASPVISEKDQLLPFLSDIPETELC
jgi:dTDP-4-dehydrorhamnose 3,5-epimerase